jgi:cell division inhibitor SepF
MNLLKRFVRNDNADLEEDYDEMYKMPDDIQMPDMEAEENVSALDSPARKEPEIHPASAEKVTLKLLQPKSHTEATKIADKLKEGCIVLLDISHLTKDQAHRLVDFLAGVAYVLGGEMIKTNKSTIVVSPAGVDISSFAADTSSDEEYEAEDAGEYEEEYEESPASEEN